MAVEELEEPMTPSQHIPPHGLATPEQIADRFLRLVGHMDGGQLAGAKEPDELDGIATIGLDSLASSPWRQCRGNHRARDAARGDLPVEVVARYPGLVARGHRPLPGEALKQTPDEVGLLRHLALLGLRLPRSQDRDDNLPLAVIERHVCSTLVRDRPPFRLWLCSFRNNPRSCDRSGRSFHIV
jgi:hypothetical protein